MEPLFVGNGPGLVYLISRRRRGSQEQTTYKIGHTVQMKKRFSAIRYSNRYYDDLEIIHTIEVTHRRNAEAFWHGLFAESRVENEWFALSKDDVDDFCACAGPADVSGLMAQLIRRDDTYEPIFALRLLDNWYLREYLQACQETGSTPFQKFYDEGVPSDDTQND